MGWRGNNRERDDLTVDQENSIAKRRVGSGIDDCVHEARIATGRILRSRV
jgi:hypothetical protein